MTSAFEMACAATGRAWARRITAACLYALSFLSAVALPTFTSAQSTTQGESREDLLLRVLSTSPSFRVRVQAAVALSHLPPSPRIVSALRAAQKDSHPSVREACSAALVSLERDKRAPEPAAPAPNAKYYVQVFEPSAKTSLSPVTLKAMHQHVTQLVSQFDGVRVAPRNEDQAAANRVIQRDALTGFALESVVTSVERRENSVRVSVSVVVASYPGRSIRAMLTGSASVSGGGTGDAAQRRATEVAFASAMKQIPQVFDSSRLQANAATASTRPVRTRPRPR